MLLAWSAIEVDSVNTNVALVVRRVLWELASHGSRTTALGIVDRVRLASLEALGIRACLGASRILVNELNIGVLVAGNLEVIDGGLLLGDLAAT